jgi:hypothetical protein
MKLTLCIPVLALVAVACGSASEPSPFPAPSPPQESAEETEALPPLAENANAGPSPEAESCAAATIEGKLAPVHLVIAQDISGSMCQLPTEPVGLVGADCNRPGTKWALTLEAMNAFFKDPASANTSVSIIAWSGLTCGTFETPLTPTDVALPDTSERLVNAMRALTPNSATPTSSAIDGAVAYAKRLQASLTDGGKVVVALATDGEPTACGDQPSALLAAARAKAASYGPYIVGVGSLIPKLDALAVASGSNNGKSFLVQGSNITQELNGVLRTIKQQSIQCAMKVPAAPKNQVLDYQKVNVVSNDGQGDVTVPYSQDCSNTGGWRYLPDASAPESIELCSARCDVIRAGGKASLKLVLGCATKQTR